MIVLYLGLAALTTYALWITGHLAWLRRRSGRCAHAWEQSEHGMQCTRCRLIKGQRGT